jgi:hypothetical protein
MLWRNVVTSEMSDGVGKIFRAAVYFKLFSHSFFQFRTPIFPQTRIQFVFSRRSFPHGYLAFWVISAKVLETSPLSKISKQFVWWSAEDVYSIFHMHVQHLSDSENTKMFRAHMKMTVFWDVAPCSLVEIDRRSGELNASIIRAVIGILPSPPRTIEPASLFQTLWFPGLFALILLSMP